MTLLKNNMASIYKIEITPVNKDDKSYITKIETDNIEQSMEQYQRNREPLTWEMMNWNIRV
tara:strand:+ start:686 stop:868 length:183 start_codon:yes stop_codon:yes gene_type:complete